MPLVLIFLYQDLIIGVNFGRNVTQKGHESLTNGLIFKLELLLPKLVLLMYVRLSKGHILIEAWILVCLQYPGTKDQC